MGVLVTHKFNIVIVSATIQARKNSQLTGINWQAVFG